MKAGRFRLRRRGGRFFKPKGGPLGFAEFAGWMAGGRLWMDGWFTRASRGPVAISITLAGHEHEIEAQPFGFSRSDLSELPAAGQILILPLDVGGEPPSIDAVHLELDGTWYAWTGSRGMPIRPDLAFRLPEKVSAFTPEIEQAFRQFWDDVCVPADADDVDEDPIFELNAAAVDRLIPPPVEEVEEEEEEVEEEEEEVEEEEEEVEEEEEEVEEEPPACLLDPGQPLGVSLEQVVAIDDHCVFLRGWWWDAEHLIEALDLISPEGEHNPLLDSVIRTARPDVADLYRPSYGDRADGARGFFGLVALPEPADGHRGYRLELRPAAGEPLQVGKRPPICEPFAGREVALSSLPEDQAPDLALLRDHVVPTLETLQARCHQEIRIAGRFEFSLGSQPPAPPEISILIPVFRRLDLVEHQLAHLAGDPSLANCELLYVLDSPELASELEENLFHMSRLFELPIRGVVMECNVGPAGAINAATAEARGRRLVMLHSDVFADRPGWIGPMSELLDSNKKVGVVGPRLLYEDRALQHAGIYFSRDRRPDGLWSAVPFFKGLPERFPGAAVARQVPAVSSACLMIDRHLFERVGGLRDVYVAGDLEDADLCLRCWQEGHESWYLPEASLYHLEGMSGLPGPGWRRNAWTELYNRYQFDRRWDERIRQLMAGFQDEPTP